MSLALTVCLLVLLLLTLIGAPVALAMILSAVGYLLVTGQDLASAGEQVLNGMYDSYILLAIPLFIVSANVMNAGSLSERLLRVCTAWVGRFRGGLGHVNVLSSLVFSGMSGSAIADAAGIGKVVITMMTRGGRYSGGYAAAITSASATIGPIVPPSIPMMLYALISDQSIAYLFLGGVLPGVLIALMLMLVNVFIAHKRDIPREEPVPWTDLPRLTAEAVPALLMPFLLLFFIYTGITTPTEAAAVAACYAFLVTLILYRTLSWASIRNIFVESARASASVGMVIAGALVLNYIVASEQIPDQLGALFASIEMGPLTFLFLVNLVVLVLGAFLDASTIILVVLPLFVPAASALGIDLIHFGVVTVMNCMIGLITPPYGMLLFVTNAVTGIPLGEIIREIWVFVLALVASLVVLILWPDLVLWLPRLAGYQY